MSPGAVRLPPVTDATGAAAGPVGSSLSELRFTVCDLCAIRPSSVGRGGRERITMLTGTERIIVSNYNRSGLSFARNSMHNLNSTVCDL